MKATKKLLALLLALTMVFGLATTAFAADEATDQGVDTGSIKILNPAFDTTYNAYRLLDLETWDNTDTDGETAVDPDVDDDRDGKYSYKLNPTWCEFFGYSYDTKTQKYSKIATPDAKAYGDGFVTGIDDYGVGYVTWCTGDAPENKNVVDFAKKALEWADYKNIDADETMKTNKKEDYEAADLDTEGNLKAMDLSTDADLGYYLVDTTLGALCSLGTTDQIAEIREKNKETTSIKEVDTTDGSKTPGFGEENTANIGDIVKFKATIYAQKGATGYVYHDKMCEGLTFDSGTVQVYVNYFTNDDDHVDGVLAPADGKYTLVYDAAGVTHTYTAEQVAADPTILNHPWLVKDDTDGSYSCTCTFDVTFTEDFLKTLNSNDEIQISYSAVLNDKAEIIQINENDSTVRYGDNNFTEPDNTKTWTFRANIWKFWDENGTTEGGMKNLPGADFVLYQADNDANPTKYRYLHAEKGKVETATDVWHPTNIPSTTSQWQMTEELLDFDDFYTQKADGSYEQNANFKASIMTTGTDGYIKLDGLDAGTYYLQETKAPAGYNQLRGPIKVIITPTTDDEGNEIDGVTVEYQTLQADGTYSTARTATKKYKLDGNGAELTGDTNLEADHVIRVENKTGNELPSTGGMGTTLFYVFGGLLTVAAVVLLITKKRVNG